MFQHAADRVPVRAALAAALLLLCSPAAKAALEPLTDAPALWHEDDQRDIPQPEAKDPNLTGSLLEAAAFRPLGRLTHPGRAVRRLGALFGGDHVPPAANRNSLGEVPNSSWFTNRIGLYPMDPEQVAQGPGAGRGPDPEGPWTVIRAKTQGVTPGFNIRDRRGDVFVIKFDPPGYPHTTSAAGVITARLLHAAGYNVPDDSVVRFRRKDLVVGEDVKIVLEDGSRRAMTEKDLDLILREVHREGDKRYRAVASRFLDGVPLGPFDYKGTRGDDPNDRIDHQNRRELRGLRVIAAWLNHFDTKRHNSLDMFVEQDGRGFVRHYLIDFASTLGAGALGPNPTLGFEYSFDLPAVSGRLLALGFHEDQWRRLYRPEELDEIGYFEARRFDPLEWKPQIQNSAFADMTDEDGYWAAKIVTAFREEHLRAAVEAGRYEDLQAEEYMVILLGDRRDKIGRTWFDRVPPLDYFRVEDGGLVFRDLGVEREIYPAEPCRYRVRAAAADAGRETAGWTEWQILEQTRVDLDSDPAAGVLAGIRAALPSGEGRFLALEFQVDRGEGWSGPVTAYLSPRTGRIVAVDR